MNEALWLLLKLRCYAFFRRIGRGLKTVKGVILAVLLGLMFLSYCAGMVLTLIGARSAEARVAPANDPALVADGKEQAVKPDPGAAFRPDPERARRWIALGLLAYTIVVLVSGSGAQALTFSPPEVNFLFPGPFTRRELLAYKLVQPALLALPAVLFLGTPAVMFAGTVAGAYLGVLLVVAYVQLLAVAVHLACEWLGAWAARWGRRGVAVTLALALAAGLAVAAPAAPAQSPGGLLLALEQSAPVRAMLVPAGWFAAVFAGREFWPDVLGYAALAVGVNALLLVVIFATDARYLEASAAASAKAYARLERMRSGSIAAAFAPAPGRPRFSLPDLPDWGGAGPVLWRQTLTALRGLKGMTVFLLIIVGSSLGPMAFASLSGDNKLPGPGLAGMLVGMVGMLSLMATQMIAFDFRADYERMDTLKALPVAATRVVLGQLATPVLLATLFQAGACVFIAAAVPDAGPVPLVALAFLVPVNVLSIGLDNLLFLIYPTRLVAAGPADVRTGLRQMLVMFAKLAGLAVAAGLAGGAAALAYFLLGRSWAAALAAGWLVLALACVPVVPLCAAAFRKFDVSRDV